MRVGIDMIQRSSGARFHAEVRALDREIRSRICMQLALVKDMTGNLRFTMKYYFAVRDPIKIFKYIHRNIVTAHHRKMS